MVVPLWKPACWAARTNGSPCATANTASARRTRSRRSLLALAMRSKAAHSSAVTGRSTAFCKVAMVALPSATGVSPFPSILTTYLRRDPLAPAAAAVDNGRLYVAGGIGPGGLLSRLDEYKPPLDLAQPVLTSLVLGSGG